jgi:hypothetical protein
MHCNLEMSYCYDNLLWNRFAMMAMKDRSKRARYQMYQHGRKTFAHARSLYERTRLQISLSHLLQKWSSQNEKTWSKANSFIMSLLIQYLCPTKVYRQTFFVYSEIMSIFFTLKLSWILRKRSDTHACANLFNLCQIYQDLDRIKSWESEGESIYFSVFINLSFLQRRAAIPIQTLLRFIS